MLFQGRRISIDVICYEMLLFATICCFITIYICCMETQVKKTFTFQEMAAQYNVSLKTFYVWLKPIRKQLLEMNPGSKQRLRILLPKQIKLIQEFLG